MAKTEEQMRFELSVLPQEELTAEHLLFVKQYCDQVVEDLQKESKK